MNDGLFANRYADVAFAFCILQEKDVSPCKMSDFSVVALVALTHVAKDVLNFFESIALMLELGHLDADSVWSFFERPVRFYCWAFFRAIEGSRRVADGTHHEEGLDWWAVQDSNPRRPG